ncbi:hypothetical protein SAMN05428970_2638 [Agromyces sp. CF514]|uniref:hypothetical protein n=1 Tax=Agromyces sp. CF514 TaxID=1881031 RepID=UPI0008F3F57B|nr:hypothetical protein [Agromyces sp. CF514]SFR82617.1 hypothetical protein SAMN05428970_2638 [Agromyces sp. CF514]
MKSRKVVALGATAAIALAGLAFGAAPAQADPISDGYSVVGSDTLQDAVGALANGTGITGSQVKLKGAGTSLASWDAFTLGVSGGVGKIQTKAFGNVFDRPNGSGAGRTALLRSINYSSSTSYNGVNVAGQIDLARSSSKGTSVAGGVLTYLPFGQDAIGFIYKIGADANSNGDAAAAKTWIDGLTTAELNSFYSASSPVAVPGTDYTVKPLAIQSSSGTWTTFLSKIGVTNIGGAVDTRNNSIPENDGTVLTPAADQIQLIPLSVANYIGQVNGASRINTMAGVTVGTIGGVAPATGTAPNVTPNTAYFNSSTWGRTVFIVVPTARITPGNAAYDQGLFALTDPAASSSLTYWGASGSPATTKAVKAKFGFSAPQDAAFTANN